MAVTRLKLQLRSLHKGFCFQIDVQNIVGAVLSQGEAHTPPEISFILQPYCFDLHYGSCVFGCVNVLLLRQSRILVVRDHLCLQFIPISLITYWPPIYILLVWQVAVYIPEGKPHFQGASTGYSILKTGFAGMAHHLRSLQLFHLPHGDHVRQKKLLSQRTLSLLRGKRDLQAVKSQAEIKLSTGCRWGLARQSCARTPEPFRSSTVWTQLMRFGFLPPMVTF